MLAHRTRLFETSGTAKARAAAKAAAARGMEIIDLSAGEIWADAPEPVRRAAVAAVENGVNRYTDTTGSEALRLAIAARLSGDSGQPWTADQVAVTAGAKQALFHAALVLLDPGHEVIIPAPYWSTFPAQVQIAGARPVFVDTRRNGYVPEIGEIAGAVGARTRAIVVNTPNNPTGTVYGRALLRDLAHLACEKNLWVIFDECYGSLVHEPLRHESIVALVPEARERTVVINSFSKSLALTGWRLGYLAAPPAVIAAAKALQSHTTSNPNVIAQHAVLAYLQQGDRSYEEGLRQRLTEARRRATDILSSLRNVPQPPAQGGFYLYLDLASLVRAGLIADADDLANRLLSEYGVAVVSGSAFGDPNGIRLSYGITPDLLETGLRRLVEAVNSLSPAAAVNSL